MQRQKDHSFSDTSIVNEPVAMLIGDMNLLRCFIGTNIRTFILSRDEDDVLRYSRYFRHGSMVPNQNDDPEGFISALIDIGGKFREKPTLYFCNDGILLLVSKHREKLEKYYRFLMPPHEIVEGTVDKTKFGILSEKYGLPVPQTLRSSNIANAEEALKSIGLPCILKPDSRHHGWDDSDLIRNEGGQPQKVLRADTPDEFRKRYAAIRQFTNSFVIQSYIPGGDDNIFSFHGYFDRESRPLAYFIGRKIRTYPKDSGISTYLQLVKDPEVTRVGLDILKKLNFVGPVKLDFKKDARNGELYLLELNARFTLWNHLGTVCGINIPQIAWDYLHGKKCELRAEYKTGVKWLSFGNDVRAFWKSYRPDHDLTWTQWLSSFRGKKVYDLFSWRDPLPSAINTVSHTRQLIGSLLRGRS
jgi:predicted ATP-grasp superfamily ATP-dependent carboligase